MGKAAVNSRGAAGTAALAAYHAARAAGKVLKPQLKKRPAAGPQALLPLPPSRWPPGVAVSKPSTSTGKNRRPSRPFWLPADWAVGVKTTCHTFLNCYVSPEKKMYYHKVDIEKALGVQLGPDATKEGCMRWAFDRLQNLEDWSGQKIENKDDGRLFALLSKEERALLPPISEFHIGVVSARRAAEPSGIKDIVGVEVALRASGAKPRWYVDAASLDDYRALGLDAVVGGKLTPARNMALEDAARQKKLCVQVSDDISKWQYWNTSKTLRVKNNSFSAQNELSKSLRKSGAVLDVSPTAAMRFMAAKMRAAGAKLCGVYPQANIARAFTQPNETYKHFILGDFFVADESPVRFDEAMTLKEDYDYTCAHMAEHGKVLRCNRMIIIVKHSTNAGGAVAVRDSAGVRERENIEVLMRKWPGAFRRNPTRPNEVILAWKDNYDKDKPFKPKAPKAPKAVQDPCKGLPPKAVVKLTKKGEAAPGFVGDRCRKASGMKVAFCLSNLTYKDGEGKTRQYKPMDLKYDLGSARLQLVGGGGKAISDGLAASHWSVNKPSKPSKRKAAMMAGA